MWSKRLICLLFSCISLSVLAAEVPRWAQGYMDVESFLAFLHAEGSGGGNQFASLSVWGIMLVALLGGVAMNLTPCILPMIPINIMIIGRSVKSGVWYGLGMALASGLLGLFAALFSFAFGAIQGHPLFNLCVAGVFIWLGLGMVGVVSIDGRKWWVRRGGGAFMMGALSALLAGACVAPMLIGVLLWTATLSARGEVWALSLPFIFGLGMGLPWPFVGAGLSILPRPGAWMKIVNRLFAVVLFGFALWYLRLAWIGFGWGAREGGDESIEESGVIAATPATFEGVASKLPRPILVDCWASWCKNCEAMERTTLRSRRVQEALKGFSVIKLQAEKIEELRALRGFEGVMGLPAYIILE